MKLEVGMYVRTKKGKIYKFDTDNSMAKNGAKKYMVNCSYNIIDLIEDKDLLEIEYYSERYEKRVTRLFEVSKYNQYLTFSNAKCEFLLSCGEFAKEDKELKPIIKSIVTKEQFESMQYKVE